MARHLDRVKATIIRLLYCARDLGVCETLAWNLFVLYLKLNQVKNVLIFRMKMEIMHTFLADCDDVRRS